MTGMKRDEGEKQREILMRIRRYKGLVVFVEPRDEYYFIPEGHLNWCPRRDKGFSFFKNFKKMV